jgi:uncharacterized repeat protein (TIGR03803 family)
MWFHSLLASWKLGLARCRLPQPRPLRQGRRLSLEQLETRLTPSLSTLASLGAPAGAYPEAGLIRDSSGNLYGTAYSGGASNDGTVFELAHGSGTLSALASFNGADGAKPYDALIMDGSGNLYGTAYGGGASGNGTVFEVAQGSGTITTLASFNGTDGANPYAGLIMDSSGNLYGTASAEGASGDGTVFELAAGSGTITTLASFNGSDGSNPLSGLIMDSSGNLYGTTEFGGAHGSGVIFELATGSSTITTLASFSGTDGANPLAGVIMDSSGNLYGITVSGGASNDGTVFELAHGSGTITALASFNGHTGGAKPYAGLIMDGSGNLYGTASSGGSHYGGGSGSVFELARGSGTFTGLALFNGTDGVTPYGGLIMDSSGDLYGTTFGDSTISGTVFELAPGSLTTLASFVTNGSSPIGGLIRDSSGNLYGTASGGGAFNYGTVFELAQGSSTITALASFNYGIDGTNPVAGLIMDGSGNLYGTASAGGAIADGTVFELAKGSGTITTLAPFNGTDGADPQAALIMDSSGNLYGTTVSGGSSGDGTVFELTRSDKLIALVSFNGTDGANPYAGLIMDSSGNLYGATVSGGASGLGTAFELVKRSRKLITLASFSGTDGANPYAGLIMDGSGNLYGTTEKGGASGDGSVFELARGSGTITTLASFNGTDGANPYAGVIMDSSGNLYGTTDGGGAPGYGTVFELAPGSGTITTLASFNGTDGANPYAGLIRDGSGHLYGTTKYGGASGTGTIFELTGAAAPAAHGRSAGLVISTSVGSPDSSVSREAHRRSAGLVISTGQLSGAGANQAPVTTRGPGIGFEAVAVAGQEIGRRKATCVSAGQMKFHRGGAEVVLSPGDIDQLFAGGWNEWP